MEQSKHQELQRLVRTRIDLARKHLNASSIQESARKLFSLESEIPGFEKKPMKFGQFVNKDFVVLMTDIRRSIDLINRAGGESSMFQIFYGYSALVANIVDSQGGTATEFLGDGILCLFEADKNLPQAFRQSVLAAKDIMTARNQVLNPVFRQFGLPEIEYGIGIDYGKTIVTRFGFKEDNDLKAFGKCAHAVSRLCKGRNEIKVSKNCQGLPRQFPNMTVTLLPDRDADNNLAYKLVH